VNKALSFLQKASNGKTVLVLFILTNLIYGAILGYYIPLVLSFAPEPVLFDYLENASIASMLNAFPDISKTLVT